jgi:Calcium-binding EGF domain
VDVPECLARVHKRALRPFLTLLTLFTLACESETPEDATGVLIMIDAEDTVRELARSLHVVVEAEDPSAPDGKTVRLDNTVKPLSFPKQVALVPKGGDAARTFTLTATALDANGELVSEARIITSYVKGELRSTTLLIEGNECLTKACDDTETCKVGRCGTAEVDPKTLSKGIEPPPTPAKDAGMDAEPDADPPEGGPDPVVDPACASRVAGERFCRGNDRLTCALDRASIDVAPCATGEVCVLAAGKTSCAKDVDECLLNTDNCDDMPEACRNVKDSFECVCPEGDFTGDGIGSEGCVDKNECGSGLAGALAACGTGATACTNMSPGYACTCGNGFTGSGSEACVDIDECLKGLATACGAGATACMNTPGSYRCTCPSGLTGDGATACADIDECQPGPVAACGAGASGCTNSVGSYMCTCSAGCTGTGSKACVDPDECAAGTAVACGAFATGCTNGACGFSCTCNPAYALNTDKHGCRARAWGTAAAIESDVASAMVPAVAVDAAGNAIAVWFQGAFGARSVYAARYTFGGTWTAPALIEQGAGDTGGPNDGMWGPQVAMNATGVAFAVWEQSDGTRSNIWAARSLNGVWSAAVMIETDNAGSARLPYVTVDSAGNAIAVWFQNDGTRDRIWANRYSGTAWGSASIISTNSVGSADNARVAGDSNGNAMAAWEQTDATPNSNIWAARFTPGGGWAAAVLVETTNPGHAWNPAIAVDNSGNAMAVWYQQDVANTGRLSIWANRFSNNAWGSAVLIESSDDGGAASTVAMDNAGNAIAAWYQYDGEWDSLYANRYSAGSWGTPQRIETQNVGNARTPAIAMDAAGNATVVWYQHDGTHTDIWANRYIGGSWISASATLLEGDNTGLAWLPAVAVSSSGSAVAVWTRFDANPLNASEVPNISGARGDIVMNRLE